jgi:hypothetical protein
VRTGSASAINCSIFFMGEEGPAGLVDAALGAAIFIVLVADWAGGRRTTPCMAGKVRVLGSTNSVLSGAGVAAPCGPSAAGTGLIVGGAGVAAPCGPSAAGTGLIVGGRGSPRAGFGRSGAGWKGGGSSDSGRGFRALKKMSGQGMGVGSCAQFQGMGMNLGKPRGLPVRTAVMTPDPNAEVIRKQDRLFSSQGSKGRSCARQ